MLTVRTKKLILIVGLLALPVFSFQNCAELLSDASHGNFTAPSETDLAYQAIASEAQVLLNRYCVECHSPGNPNAGPISNILDQSFLEAQGFIIIGSPQSSSLYLGIIDGIEPRDSDSMSASEIETIRDWILGPEFYNDNIGGSVGGGGSGGTPATPATFANVNSMIIQPQCIRCHGAGDPRGSLANYAAVRTYVIPGSLSSELWQQVALNQMPQGAPPLSPNLKSLLQRWIQAGAPNN